jgi:hypothetical protein
MSVPQVLSSAWNNPAPYPSNEDLNPVIPLDPCRVYNMDVRTNANSMQVKNKYDILSKYQNIRYQNENSYNKLLRLVESEKLDRYMSNRNFFSNPADGEDKEKRNVDKISLENPDFRYSTLNEKLFEKEYETENKLNPRVMSDNGVADFRYDVKAPDFIKMVQESKQAYIKKRDRFFITPQKGSDQVSKDVSELLRVVREQQGSVPKRTSRASGTQKRRETRARSTKIKEV